MKSSPVLSKKERKIERTKSIILNAAEELFSKREYDMVTMEEIAERAALSRATLYIYFNTKEKIYFKLGISKIKELINQYELEDRSKLSGEQQLLILSESLLQTILEAPFYCQLIRKFFNRSKEANLSIEDIFYKILIEKNKTQLKTKSKSQHKIVFDLLEKYIEYRKLWQKSIEKGLIDGSIQSNSNIHHLNFFIIMLIFGLVEQIDLRRSLMTQVGLKNIELTKFILTLIKKLLHGEI